MISIVACCPGVNLCAHAARDFQSQQNGAVTRIRRSCRVQPNTKNVRLVWTVAKRRGCCCNLSGGVASIVWFTTNGMCVKNNTIMYVAQASNSKRDCDTWSLLLLAAAVRSFAHMPLRISDCNKMVLRPGCGGRAEFSLNTKNVWPVWFVVKRRGCCCNLLGGVALIVWFTMNRMCVKTCVVRASNNKRDCDAWSLLLLAAAVRSFVHMPLGISDRNNTVCCIWFNFAYRIFWLISRFSEPTFAT